MGRHYNGHIAGKFWVAIQSSSPMKQFGAREFGQRSEYMVCGCVCEDNMSDKAYCADCWESHEQHLAEVVEQEADDEITETWRVNESCGEWEFEREDFELNGIAFINQHQELFDKYINKITFDATTAPVMYEYELEWRTGEDGKQLTQEIDEMVILADLCMLKQIQKFFDENPDEDTCEWEAEY